MHTQTETKQQDTALRLLSITDFHSLVNDASLSVCVSLKKSAFQLRQTSCKQITLTHVFHSCDLELHLMTSIHKSDLNISKMYLHTKNELSRSWLLK